jgi:hypothetical protein
LRIIGTPVKHDNYLDKQNKNKEKKEQSDSLSKRSKDGEIPASSYSGQTDAEDFFQDFLSSLESTCLIQDSFSKDIGTHLEGGCEDTILNGYEDSFLPIINLLPRLTEDLAAQQRRPNPAWFKKSYTNTSTVQKIYLPKPKCTPIRR